MAEQELKVTRVLKASRELVFRTWTDPDHFGKWWGPKGFTLKVEQMDVRPGGMFLGSQTSPDGAHMMWGKFIYREVTAPEKLVYVSSFSDEKGNTIRAPFNPNWPLEIINTITLAQRWGKTSITLEGGPLNPTEDERATFEGMAPMVRQGLVGTLDQLADYLAKRR